MRIRVISILAVLVACATLWGQAISTSQINGTVRDSTGLAVPGSEVKATQTETGLVRTVTSGADGGYTITNLPVGPYQVEVSKEGFSKYVQSGIVLQVGSNPTVDIALKVGAVTEQVQVEANGALVETRNAGVGSVIDNQRVLELPLNGRQATELVFLTGMATAVNGAGLNSGVRNFPTVDISVAGGLANGLTYRLDGATHNDPYNNLNLPFPFPDALQEFKVETSALPAQYGHHSSAAVNAVTKSGTNEFHGDAFEFIRNGAVNARYFFAATQDSLKRNQLGGTFGGPILKNKLFFFLGEQATLLRTAPTTNIAYVPTAQMLAGDFSAITSPACNTSGKQVTLSAPFVNNQISPALFSSPAVKIVNFPGFPTSTNPCGTVQFGRSTRSNQYDSLARTDYQKSDKHSLFVRYLQAHLDQPSDYDPKNLLAASTAALNFQTTAVAFGDTYLIGASTVSNFRADLNRAAVPKINPQVFGPTDVGINMWPGVPGLMRISITNGFNLASNNETPSTYNTTEFEISEDVSTIRGGHQLGVGFDFIRSYLDGTSGLNASGPFTFNGQVASGSSGVGLADFMIGKPSALTQATTTMIYSRMNYFGLYAQDAWKLTSRLTVSYGLRWDPYLPTSTKYGWTPHFDPTWFAEGTHSTVFAKAPAGLQFPGDSLYPSGNGVANHRWNNFAPRLALAWDPKGDGKSSLRAAYGRFFDLPSHNNYVGFGSTPPVGNTTTVNFPATFADPWAGIPGGNPYPIVVNQNTPFINFGTYENFLLNPKTTYSQQWNLSYQRQVATDVLVTANYVGTSIIHLWGGDQANPGIYIPGTCGASACSTAANVNNRRLLYLLNPAQGIFYGSINQLDAGGTAHYNGVVFSVQKRSSKGYSVQANYTLSHCISDLPNPELAVAGANFMIPGDRRADRGNCQLGDRRQLFSLSAVYATPKFNNSKLRLFASGWQISPLIRAQTGPFMTVTTGIDQALTGQTTYERPNLVNPNVYQPNRNPTSYLNPAAFAQPALGTYGNLGTNNILAPGAFYFNAALTRTFAFRERKSIQFRFEAFNIPNHTNFGPPNGASGNGTAAGSTGLITPTVALNSPTFGKILSSDDPRILQGALKFIF